MENTNKRKRQRDAKTINGKYDIIVSKITWKCKDLHGEAGSVDESTIQEWFSKVSNIIKDKDVYNLDETG